MTGLLPKVLASLGSLGKVVVHDVVHAVTRIATAVCQFFVRLVD